MNILRSFTRRSTPTARRRELNNDAFSLSSYARYGLSAVPTVVCHDPVQSLIAVGLSSGEVFVAGKGVQKVLPAASSVAEGAGLKLLAFKTGDRLLVGVNAGNELIVWSLQSCDVQFSPVSIEADVRCLEVTLNSRWVFVGLGSGEVWAFDTVKGVKARYSISCQAPPIDVPSVVQQQLQHQQPQQTTPPSEMPVEGTVDHSAVSPQQEVISLALNPIDTNILLIGYSTGHIVSWNIKDFTVLLRFQNSPTLSALAWRPDGQHFVAAHDEYVSFWSVKEGGGLLNALKGGKEEKRKPLWVRTVERTGPKGSKDKDISASTSTTPKHPINSLIWVRGSQPDDNLLVILGGTPQTSPKSLTLLDLSGIKDYKSSRFHTVIPTPQSITSFAFAHSTHSGLETFVLALGEDGKLRGFDISKDYASYDLPVDFVLSSTPRITCSVASACTEFLVWEMSQVQSASTTTRPLPITGGSIHNKNNLSPTDILCTAHVDGTLSFHHLSIPSIKPLSTLATKEYLSMTKINKVEMDLEGRLCWVVAGPHVLVYRFYTESDLKGGGEELMGEDEMDKLMKQMDETVDGILAGGTGEGSPKVSPKVEGSSKAEKDAGAAGMERDLDEEEEEEVEGRLMMSPVEEKELDIPSTPPLAPPLRTASASTPTSPAPAPPPRTASTPQSPASPAHSSRSTPSRHQHHQRADSIATSTIVVEVLSERVKPTKAGWHPILQGIHMDLVVKALVVAAGDLLVTATQGGILHFVRLSTGEILHTDILLESSEEEPTTPGSGIASFWGGAKLADEQKRRSGSVESGSDRETGYGGGGREPGVVTCLDIWEGCLGRDTSTRTVLFVGTEGGTWTTYDLEPSTEGVVRFTRSLLHKSRFRTPAISSYVLNAMGHLSRPRPRNTPYASPSTPPSPEYYSILVEARQVTVLLSEPGSSQSPLVAARFAVSPEDGEIVKAGVSRRGGGSGDPVLVLLTQMGWCVVVGLPGLEVLWECNVLEMARMTGSWGGDVGEQREKIEKGLVNVFISSNGRIIVQSNEKEFSALNIMSDRRHLPDVEIRLYDVTKAYAWARANGLQPGNTSRNAEMDALFMPQDPSRHDSGHETGGEQPPAANAFEQARNQLNERGERLQNLEHKFGDLSNSAQGFAASIREYNERQANKKWWVDLCILTVIWSCSSYSVLCVQVAVMSAWWFM
ncbi:hypothetical protein HK097_006309 [Rhizophlyctis rosea]|uniref:V-SNARE coiled-coil homology domain-containing protein n=1 Tax=Rhizophlyctis rosea TaxID=64517 RepID=A0AAD5SCY9_9FUNG|nr:hypothetical protein HK097_006309 [Rhizophlyctis rosea]